MSSTDSRIARPEFRFAIILAAWTLFGLAQIILAAAMTQRWNAVALSTSFLVFMPRVWGWALLTPIITRWDAEARKAFPSLAGRMAAHAPLYLMCVVVEAVIRRSTVVMLGNELEVPFYVTVFFFADAEAVRYVASLMLGRVLDASSEFIRKERREVALKEEIARAQLHYLDLQLQPHFLFNALGSISELAHEAPQAAARMVDHLTSLLRYATESRSAQFVTLREELAALDPYLQIQRMRFPDWLSIEERIESGAQDAMIPRMLLQPLVENAIRHGLSHRDSGGRIIFGASVHGGDLVISVYDNGAGLQAGASRPGLGIGLANIRERLTTLYDEAQSLELVDHQEGGVEVLLRIPFRREAPALKHNALEDADDELRESVGMTAAHGSTRSEWLELMWGWIVAGVFMLILSLSYVFLRHPDSHEPAMDIVGRHAVYDGLWMILTPIVIALGRKFPISRRTLSVSLPFHLIVSTAISWLHLAATWLLVGRDQPLGSFTNLDSLFWNLAAYFILIGIAHRAAIEGWIREKDLAAGKMRAELTTARLSTVMVELRPEFLLSSLHALRKLVTLDARKAEILLTNLADFLRLTMESLTRQSITVEREISLLESYARVHRSGEGYFPAIQRVIPSSLENAIVPSGVTRILAERLIEKGDVPETIVVSVRRIDDALSVRVAPSEGGITSAGVEVDLPFVTGKGHAADQRLVLQHA
ncbi:MAG TPA: histidine kinase [Gemmatimonadaceae bacterium]|nr:histidine kinase [Gemmatimonadaceae bacterium]